MGATGRREGPDQRKTITRGRALGKAADHLKPGLGRRTFGKDALLQPDGGSPMFPLAIQRSVHQAGLPFRPAPRHGQIFLGETQFLHEQAESARGGRRLGHQNQPARLAVEPVDDRDLAASGDLKGEQVAQGLPKRGRAVRLGRMS